MNATNITPGRVRAFQAVTTQLYGEVTLWSCRINGEPGVAIVLAERVGEGKIGIMPLFVAITPKMDVTFEGEEGGGKGGGGSKRVSRQQGHHPAGLPSRVTIREPRRVRPARFSLLFFLQNPDSSSVAQ